MRKTTIANGGLAALFTLSALVLSAPPAEQAIAVAETDPSAACITEAVEGVDADAWVCLGNDLSYNAGTEADPDWKVKRVEPPANSLALSTDADTWCESGSGICARLVTDYVAEVKGNAVFGDSTGVLGRFDVYWRSFLKGPRVWWRLHLVHDDGQAVRSERWEAWAREENFGPDGYFCFALFYPDIVNANSRHAWAPAKDKEEGCNDAFDKTETWHDDLAGRFESGPPGNVKTFVADTLHTAHWKTWQKADGSYDAKMTSAWDY